MARSVFTYGQRTFPMASLWVCSTQGLGIAAQLENRASKKSSPYSLAAKELGSYPNPKSYLLWPSGNNVDVAWRAGSLQNLIG